MQRYGSEESGDRDIFVGVDVQLRQWHVTVRTMESELFSASIPASWLSLSKVLSRYSGDRVEVVYEAGFSGYWLADQVLAWGAECLVTPPSLIPTMSGNRVKTDKRDSRKLSWLLSRGMLRSVWIPPLSQRGHRQVLRRRRQFVQDRVRLQSRIKSELALHGLSVKSGPGRWSGPLVARLSAMQLADEWSQASYDRLLASFHEVSAQLVEQTRLLREVSRLSCYRETVRLLRTIPGIGLITAMALILELGDWGRFQRADCLAAYLGLTPSQYSSGDRIRMGRITGMGNRYLRGLMIEAAWIAIRRDGRLRAVYDRITVRAGKKRAIVAVARRLVLAARRVVLDQEAFRCQTAA